MTKNILEELSNAMADAVERTEKTAVMVTARKRMPASGIGFVEDLIITAGHVIDSQSVYANLSRNPF